MVIWKFSLATTGRQSVSMPIGSKILSVQDQHGSLQMWAMVDPSAKNQLRHIEIVGTGNPIDDVEKLNIIRSFIGTVQTRGGSLVWHIFELIQG